MPELTWVFDTVVLCNFLLSDAMDVIRERYSGRAVITEEVFDEIASGIAEYPKLKEIKKDMDNGTIRLQSLSSKERDHFLGLIGHLGKGEASCIALAKDQNLVVATDDRAARSQCSQMNIPFTGSVGILKASYLERQMTLDHANHTLNRMIQEGFYSPVRSISEIV